MTAASIGPVAKCQSCGAPDLRSVLFLGYFPPLNTMPPVGRPLEAMPWFPTEMVACRGCSLAQLAYVPDPCLVFPPEYSFTSGMTRALRDSFADLRREVADHLAIPPGAPVVDLGSNDGTLLSEFAKHGHPVLGVEPTDTADLAVARGVPTVKRFFDDTAAAEVATRLGRVPLITATNVLAHVADVHGFLERARALLEPDGALAIEVHYLGDLVEAVEFDKITQEHLRYFSLTSLSRLLRHHSFHVVRASRIPTHGGSLRVFARLEPAKADSGTAKLLESEAAAGLDSEQWVEPFQRRVEEVRRRLASLLVGVKLQGAHIYGVGAPSRAFTLVHAFRMHDGILDCLVELPGSRKLGTYVPGTMLPIFEEARLLEDAPPYAMVLSWHLGLGVARNLRDKGYRGDFIYPLPEPRIVRSQDLAAAGAH